MKKKTSAPVCSFFFYISDSSAHYCVQLVWRSSLLFWIVEPAEAEVRVCLGCCFGHFFCAAVPVWLSQFHHVDTWMETLWLPLVSVNKHVWLLICTYIQLKELGKVLFVFSIVIDVQLLFVFIYLLIYWPSVLTINKYYIIHSWFYHLISKDKSVNNCFPAFWLDLQKLRHAQPKINRTSEENLLSFAFEIFWKSHIYKCFNQKCCESYGKTLMQELTGECWSLFPQDMFRISYFQSLLSEFWVTVSL